MGIVKKCSETELVRVSDQKRSRGKHSYQNQSARRRSVCGCQIRQLEFASEAKEGKRGLSPEGRRVWELRFLWAFHVSSGGKREASRKYNYTYRSMD